MQTFIQSFLLVAISEMGDKTQLLAFVLAARFQKPFVILWGIFLATILNHFCAAYLGAFASSWLSPQMLRWGLAATFFAFAIWILVPDKEEGVKKDRYGAFITTFVLFFLAEMGDKTQLATVALAAKFQDIWLVTLGTTCGMMLTNGLAVFFGKKAMQIVPIRIVHYIASALFALFGLGILLGF